MLSGKLWPAHPPPYPDELLSSWLVRIAHANGLKVQTFCNREFSQSYQLWNRDIDRHAPRWLIETLAEKTSTPEQQALETTLACYQGTLFEKLKASGQLRWVLPLQIYHRKRLGHGLQFCPLCLAEDPAPYYRRSWRLAFFTYCPRHKVHLLDECPRCHNGIAFYRQELGHPHLVDAGSLANCWFCKFDLRQAAPSNGIVNPIENIPAWVTLLVRFSGKASSPPHCGCGALSVVHHFCMLLTSTRLAPALYDYLCSASGFPSAPQKAQRISFEARTVGERHQVLLLAWWLLDHWPSRVRQAWLDHAIRYNELLKDFDDPPDFYLNFMQQLKEATLASPRMKAKPTRKT